MFFIHRCLLLFASGLAIVVAGLLNAVTVIQKNTPPAVNFITPHDSDQFAPTALIPYKVNVSDKEDGESKYDEIPATEVFLEVHYFSDPAKGLSFRQTPVKKDPEGYALLKKQDCFNCHAVWNKVIGPSFSDISNKYKMSDTAALAEHIIRGSTGRWGNAVMPTHADLSKDQAQQIVHWILANASDANTDYLRGAEGSIRVHSPKGPAAGGVVVLTASYTDHGTNNNAASSVMGSDKRLIRLK